MSDAETREKRFLINDRVKYGLRRSELRGSIRWLLKTRGIEIEQDPFSREGRRKLRDRPHNEGWEQVSAKKTR
jgi:hypothetical protein